VTPQVLNTRTASGVECRDAVYVGRPSKWGNPYVVGADGTREEVIERYRAYLLENPELRAALSELRGRNLVCWCAPLPCHADVLLELANSDEVQA
jgi:hypothetical protein